MSSEDQMAAWSVAHGPRGMARWLRVAALAVALGVGMALWVGVAPALLVSPNSAASLPTGGSLHAQIAQACGIGAAPTMMANKIAALAYPFNGGIAQQQILGTFPLNYAVNQPVSLYEDFSRVPFAPSPTSFTWRWNFGDGSATGSGVTVSHTYTKTGTYLIESDIYQSGAWSLFDNAQVHIVADSVPTPPVAKAVALTSTSIITGQSITFDSAGSHAIVGSALTYTWNFGDNTSATGERVTHQYTSPGLGTATLIVTDARGAQSMAIVNIAIGQPGAKAQANVSSAKAGTAIAFSASDPGLGPGPSGVATLNNVAWDFGDGTAALTTKTASAAHSFSKAGTFTVTARLLNTDSSVFVAKVTVTVTAAPGGAGGGSRLWWLGGGALALLVVIGAAIYFWLAQQRKLALAQRRAARNRPGGRGGAAGRAGQPGGRPNPYAGRQGPPVPAGRRLAPDRPGMPGASGSAGASRVGGRSSGGYPTPARGGAANGGYPQRPPTRPNGAIRRHDEGDDAGYGDERASRPRRAPNSAGGAQSRPGVYRSGQGGSGNPGAQSRPNGYPPARPRPSGGYDDYDE